MLQDDIRQEEAVGTQAVAPARRRALPGSMVYRVTVLVALIWTVLDQALKVLALRLPPQGIGDGPFRLTLVFNENAAFGIPGFPGMFLIVTVVVLGLVVRALPRTDRLSLAFAYGLVAGGAVGNAIDRVVRPPGFPRGAVVDYLDIGVGALRWPTFNIADVGIVAGGLLVVVLVMRVDREERREEERRRGHRSIRPEQTGPRG